MNLHRNLGALRALALSLLLAACGGGVETGGTGATGSYVEGTINGFGSVIVEGIRFDDSAAGIEDSDGSRRNRGDLRLGMRVEVQASAIGTDADGSRSAVASRVRIATDLLGPVTFADAGANAIAVLGQAVRVTPATVLEGLPTGLGSLVLGDIVEVHGFLEPGLLLDRFIATRIERRTAAPDLYRVRGQARDVDSAAGTLRMGGQLFDYASIGAPPGLANGRIVRMRVQTTQTGGRWPVLAIEVESRRLEDREEAEVEGVVTAFTSLSRFEVNGIAVDAGAASFPDGTVGLAVGALVKVEGRAVGGVLIADEVELRTDDDAFNEGIDLRDAIGSLDLVSQTFVVRGVTVFYGTTPAPTFENGTIADLGNGVRVRVRAVLSADRTRVEARRIEFTGG